MYNIQDHVVIITGSSSGIGLAASTLALASGAKVLGIDISNSPASLTANPNYTFFAADLSHPESAKKAIAACIAAYGNRIDGLLNIAGVMDLNQSADTVTDDMWDRCIAINLTAPVKLMREVIPIMRLRGKGSIVNVGSKASMSGAVSGVAYTASKHGLVGATKNVAWRFKHEGIRCNIVCPGGVAATGIRDGVDSTQFDSEALEMMTVIHQAHASDHAKGLGLQPEDLAHSLLYFLSDLSKGISGAVIPVDNAWSTI
ncbi:short-chain dehydrogenase/reductase SDR [Penicillium brasilianum]|uniref:Meroterpenoid PM-122-9-5657 n=1 Tax=Penicillium brasilianum TaxID=104259 RepID=A0A1S9RNA1_PENBI|nr:meroterpenoid PM-122-9-5657 [Penicillium brasilianum]OOQ86836.1 short-chain dehydrogenase/reductase SDR [Penicillium brasilianum]